MSLTNRDDEVTERIERAREIVALDAQCSLSAALLLMRARAASSDTSLAFVAEGVLNGSIRWDDYEAHLTDDAPPPAEDDT
jgi:hypothetical protein